MTPGDRLWRRWTAAIALALMPALTEANGAAPLVQLEVPPLVCETGDGAAVAVDDASIGGTDMLEIWDGPIKRQIPLSQVEAVEFTRGVGGLSARLQVGGQAVEGSIRAPEGGDLMLAGREPTTGAEIEVDLASCARLYRNSSASNGGPAAEPEHAPLPRMPAD